MTTGALKSTLASTLTAGIWDVAQGKGSFLENTGTAATLGIYNFGEKKAEAEEDRIAEAQAAQAAEAAKASAAAETPAPVPGLTEAQLRSRRIAEEYARKRAAFASVGSGTLGYKSLLGNA